MKKLTLNEAITETKKVASKMPNKDWNIHAHFVEMVEEVGELANAIQCDVLYELLRIADLYKVDLDKEYPFVLRQIDKRRRSGEFDK